MPESVSPDWPAVARVLQRHLDQRHLRVPDLEKLTTLSRNTIRDLLAEADGPTGKQHHESSLIVLAVRLKLPDNYFVRIRDGEPVEKLDEEAAAQSALEEAYRARLLQDPEKIAELHDAMASMKYATEVMQRISREITGDANWS